MINLILQNKVELRQLFYKYKVEKAYLFGSALGNQFNSKSDIDFLVKFKSGLEPLEKGELWWNLHDALRDFLKREIDIVTETSLKNPYFIEELNNTKQLIYG